MEQTLFEKFDKIVCPINVAKTPTDLENLSGLIICFLRIKSSKVIYDFSAKDDTHFVQVLLLFFITATITFVALAGAGVSIGTADTFFTAFLCVDYVG